MKHLPWLLLAACISTAQAADTPAPRREGIVVDLNADASRFAPNDLARATAFIELNDATPGALAKKVNAVIQSSLATAKPYSSVKVRSGNTSTYPVYGKNGRTIESWRMRSELLLESKDQAALSELLGKLQTQMAVGQLTRQLDHLLRHDLHAHLALNRLEEDRAGPGPDRRPHSIQVVAIHMDDAGNEWAKGVLLAGLAGERQGAVGAPVEAVVQGDHLGAVGTTPLAGQLEGGLAGLGAGVAEEHPPAERVVANPFGQLDHGLGVVEVRRVDQTRRLLADRRDHLGTRMTDVGHRNARHAVQVGAPVGVVQQRPLPAHELDRLATVVAHQRRRLTFNQPLVDHAVIFVPLPVSVNTSINTE